MPESVEMPAPVSATQLRSRNRFATVVRATVDATLTQERYLTKSAQYSVQVQLMVPAPLSRRAASATEPLIDGYTVNESAT